MARAFAYFWSIYIYISTIRFSLWNVGTDPYFLQESVHIFWVCKYGLYLNREVGNLNKNYVSNYCCSYCLDLKPKVRGFWLFNTFWIAIMNLKAVVRFLSDKINFPLFITLCIFRPFLKRNPYLPLDSWWWCRFACKICIKNVFIQLENRYHEKTQFVYVKTHCL